ncbi:hypothetical protein BDY24DRAFT_435891 [Mrakia frigida]|uniref:uncharacterized protein n=1 Tax=Mrakia frigida TaxID=29902 RepID=UPI003FCBF713
MRRPVVGGKQMKGTRSGDGDGAEKQAGAERERFGGSSKLESGLISPATKLKSKIPRRTTIFAQKDSNLPSSTLKKFISTSAPPRVVSKTAGTTRTKTKVVATVTKPSTSSARRPTLIGTKPLARILTGNKPISVPSVKVFSAVKGDRGAVKKSPRRAAPGAISVPVRIAAPVKRASVVVPPAVLPVSSSSLASTPSQPALSRKLHFSLPPPPPSVVPRRTRPVPFPINALKDEIIETIFSFLIDPFHNFSMCSLLDGITDASTSERPWNPLALQLVSKRFLEISRPLYYSQITLDNRVFLDGRKLAQSALRFSSTLAQDRETNALSIRIPFPTKVLLFFLPKDDGGDEAATDSVLDVLQRFLPPNRVHLFSFPPLASSSWVQSVTEKPWKSWTIVTREKDWDVVPRIVGPGGIDRPLKSILPPLVLRTPSTTFNLYNIAFFETLFLHLDHLHYIPSLQTDLTFPLNQLILEKLVPLLLKINA